MKRIKLFLTICLALSVFQTGLADDADVARAAAKRGNVSGVSVSGPRTNTSTKKTEPNRSEPARTIPNNTKNIRTNQSVQSRTTAKSTATVKQRSSNQSTQKTVVTRTPAVTARETAIARTTVSRKPKATKSVAATRVATTPYKNNHLSRAATTTTAKLDSIKSKNYSQCKSVYQDCMDEFCANKDANLRRCACSSRISEFDGLKKKLTDVEDKMLQFNQNLLTVGMSKEDASTISVATEGETAFSTKDKSESEKILNKIKNTLNGSSDLSTIGDSSSFTLSLDIDGAWGQTDGITGISTTAKSGTQLYDAARPVCLEMAKEVCSDNELNIAIDNYKLLIQQDCNTVSKAYNAQYNQAISKVQESGALLDMARLESYQQNNADDMLTCKKKILEQLKSSSVCGEDLHKCLDITGRYIEPSTGKAVLSKDLKNLDTLLTAPTANLKWTQVPANRDFVEFLNSKKRYLGPATEQCKDVASQVWSEFIEEALSKIKLAQTAKMEEIKRGCVTMIAECKTNAYQSIEEFDSRSSSIFSIIADKTVNTICSDVQQACSETVGAAIEDFADNLTDLTTAETKQKIIDQCVTIGKGCITGACTAASGNFELCKQTIAPVRQSIVKQLSANSTPLCWDKVYECFKNALTTVPNIEFDNITPTDTTCESIYSDDTDRKACTLAANYWGRCNYEAAPAKTTISTDTNTNTILYWFGMQTNNYTCSDAAVCPVGSFYNADCNICDSDNNGNPYTVHYPPNTPVPFFSDLIEVCKKTGDGLMFKNACEGGCKAKDVHGNCCDSGYVNHDICVPDADYKAILVQTGTCNGSDDSYYCSLATTNPGTRINVYCVSNASGDNKPLTIITTHEEGTILNPDYNELQCNGYWVLVDQYGNYLNFKEQHVSGDLVEDMCNNISHCVDMIFGQAQHVRYHYNEQKWGEFNTSSNSWVSNPICVNTGDTPLLKPDNQFKIKYNVP